MKPPLASAHTASTSALVLVSAVDSSTHSASVFQKGPMEKLAIRMTIIYGIVGLWDYLSYLLQLWYIMIHLWCLWLGMRRNTEEIYEKSIRQTWENIEKKHKKTRLECAWKKQKESIWKKKHRVNSAMGTNLNHGINPWWFGVPKFGVPNKGG